MGWSKRALIILSISFVIFLPFSAAALDFTVNLLSEGSGNSVEVDPGEQVTLGVEVADVGQLQSAQLEIGSNNYDLQLNNGVLSTTVKAPEESGLHLFKVTVSWGAKTATYSGAIVVAARVGIAPSISPTPILTLTPTPNATVELTAETINKIIESLPGSIEKISELYVAPAGKTTAVALTALTALATTATLIGAWLPIFLQNLPYILQRLFQGIYGLTVFRRRRSWGRVISAIDGTPIAGTHVQIYDTTYNQLRQTIISDTRGHFTSYLSAGTYVLRVHKPGWQLTPKATALKLIAGERVYDGRPITVAVGRVVSLTIVLRPNVRDAVTGRLRWKARWQWVEWLLLRLSWPLLLFGAGVNAVIMLYAPSAFNIVLTVVYAVLIVTKFALSQRQIPALGKIIDRRTRNPIDLAYVRLYDAMTNHLINTRVSDRQGQFLLLPNPGVYTLAVAAPGYETYQQSHLVVKKGESLPVNVALQRQ